MFSDLSMPAVYLHIHTRWRHAVKVLHMKALAREPNKIHLVLHFILTNNIPEHAQATNLAIFHNPTGGHTFRYYGNAFL